MDAERVERRVEAMAERLRQEQYHLLRNDCIAKSLRLKKACFAEGIPARMVICLGKSRCRLFGRPLFIPVIHAWVEVAGVRVETSRNLGTAGLWGIIPAQIKPLVAFRF